MLPTAGSLNSQPSTLNFSFPSPMRRRLLLILAGLIAGVVLLVATVPLWLGVAARSVGRSRGVTFGTYERVGYSRFTLRDVDFHQGNVHVTASRIEAETP